MGDISLRGRGLAFKNGGLVGRGQGKVIKTKKTKLY